MTESKPNYPVYRSSHFECSSSSTDHRRETRSGDARRTAEHRTASQNRAEQISNALRSCRQLPVGHRQFNACLARIERSSASTIPTVERIDSNYARDIPIVPRLFPFASAHSRTRSARASLQSTVRCEEPGIESPLRQQRDEEAHAEHGLATAYTDGQSASAPAAAENDASLGENVRSRTDGCRAREPDDVFFVQVHSPGSAKIQRPSVEISNKKISRGKCGRSIEDKFDFVVRV